MTLRVFVNLVFVELNECADERLKLQRLVSWLSLWTRPGTHSVEFDPLVKSELASTNQQ